MYLDNSCGQILGGTLLFLYIHRLGRLFSGFKVLNFYILFIYLIFMSSGGGGGGGGGGGCVR